MGLGGPPCAPSQPLGVPLCSPLLGSDVTFVVGREQQRVFAHRCVLACRCQAFRGMLGGCGEDPPSSVPPQGPFVLGNVQPDVFLAVIEFLYTNSVSLNSHIVSGEGGGRIWGGLIFFFFWVVLHGERERIWARWASWVPSSSGFSVSVGTGGADLIGGVRPAGPVQGMALLHPGCRVPPLCPYAGGHPRMTLKMIRGGREDGTTHVHRLSPVPQPQMCP